MPGVWLVSTAQGYDQGGGTDHEQGGDGGADADEQARRGGPARLGPVSRRGGRGACGRWGRGLRSGQGEGVDRCDQVRELPHCALLICGEEFFGVAFEERLIRDGNDGPLVALPDTAGVVRVGNERSIRSYTL